MKKLNAWLIPVLCLLLFAACAPMGQMAKPSPILNTIMERNMLVLGTAGSMPPLNMRTTSGDVIGYDVDLAAMIAGGIGVELKVVTMPFAELLPALEAGKVDMVISGMTITPERNTKVAFVGPYQVSGKAVLTKLRSLASVNEPSDLNNKAYIFTALAGSTSELLVKELMPEAQLVSVKTYDEAVAMVLENRASAMVADYAICVVSLLRHPNEELVGVITPFTYEPLGIAIPTGDPHFVNWLENFLNTAEHSGLLEDLEARWLEDGSWLREME